jgi:hypothetical protein
MGRSAVIALLLQRSFTWHAIVLALLLSMSGATACAQTAARQAAQPDNLSAAEFSRLSHEFSEVGGYFRSDNFTSNETSYLHVADKLRQLAQPGGAYIGVGPEQNFTYIAKLRPRIAFIVDIRRQAIIQHLLYKAVFQLAPTRAQFLARLLSRPLPKENALPANASLHDLLVYFSKTPADEKAYQANLAEVRKTIEKDFLFPLSEGDLTSLDYVYHSFRDDGLEISYRMEGSWGGGYFPTLREILAETDLQGKQGNFLASVEDYEFVRGLQRKNLIIPVIGDFGGEKALAAIGDYLKKTGFTVTAFYTSNVEQYLFGGDSFAAFARNVKKLPLSEKSLFIRAVAGRMPHPARVNGHRLTTLLQLMKVFVKDFDEGRYPSYTDLVTTNFIAAERP